jgi:hypothetical protein
VRTRPVTGRGTPGRLTKLDGRPRGRTTAYSWRCRWGIVGCLPAERSTSEHGNRPGPRPVPRVRRGARAGPTVGRSVRDGAEPPATRLDRVAYEVRRVGSGACGRSWRSVAVLRCCTAVLVVVPCDLCSRSANARLGGITLSSGQIVVLALLGLLLQVGVVALGVRWGVTSALRTLLTPDSSDREMLTETLRDAAAPHQGDAGASRMSSVSRNDDPL